jgi:hypothetical protein
MTMAGAVTSLLSRRKATLVFLYIRTLAPRPGPSNSGKRQSFERFQAFLAPCQPPFFPHLCALHGLLCRRDKAVRARVATSPISRRRYHGAGKLPGQRADSTRPGRVSLVLAGQPMRAMGAWSPVSRWTRAESGYVTGDPRRVKVAD